MVRWSTLCGGVVAATAVTLAYIGQDRLVRLYNVATIFRPDVITSNFRSIQTLGFPLVTVHTRDARVATFDSDSSPPLELPESFVWRNESINLKEWLEEHWTTGLVVIKRVADTEARVLHESYYRGNTPKSKCISWSLCKSIVSILIGIASDRGFIGDVKKATVTDFVPELSTSGYNGVSIHDVLTMSSGVAFNEDYFDPRSDINVMSYTIALGGSMDDFVASLKRGGEPGTYYQYASMDTQVLGMVLTRALNQSVASFLEEAVWATVGFEESATWCLDNDVDQMELVFGVLGITARDYTRIGWLMLNNGLSPSSGERIVSEEWISTSTSIDPKDTHLMPGVDNALSDYGYFGYGYQWWIGPSPSNPSVPGKDYFGLGIYGQILYMSPVHDIIIAKTAADPKYSSMRRPGKHENDLETQGYEAMRAIAEHFSNT